MKKQLSLKIWNNFLNLINTPSNLVNFKSYYIAIIKWIKENSKYFSYELIQRNRLNILMEIDPSEYIVDHPEFDLKLEYFRFKKNKPNDCDTFLMIISNKLWSMVTIKSEKDCPNCGSGELTYLVIKNNTLEEILLECENCAWLEKIDGTEYIDKIDSILPANKHILKKFGIQFN